MGFSYHITNKIGVKLRLTSDGEVLASSDVDVWKGHNDEDQEVCGHWRRRLEAVPHPALLVLSENRR